MNEKPQDNLDQSSISVEGSSEETITNRVSNSQLVTLDLEEFYSVGERVLFDIKNWLYQSQILREKDFRMSIKAHDWTQYQNKFVAITCSVDAIIPTWAFMLVSISLKPYAKFVFFGSLPQLEIQLFIKTLDMLDWKKFYNAKVVIKGCSKVEVPVAVYVEAVNRLQGLATSIMYGEPCSTVPLYKRFKG